MEIEDQIIKSAKSAISKSLHEIMTKYGSPLNKLTEKVIENNSTEIYNLMNDAFTNVLISDDFKSQIKDEFKHKVAKLIVSNASGMVDKQINKLKQDPIMKAKIIVAIENVLTNKQN